jgi:hypothetical protein
MDEERKLRNLHTISEIWTEEAREGSEKWVRVQSYSASIEAWYNGLAGGQQRLNVQKETTEWVGGPSPFSVASYVVAFNGKTSKRIETEVGDTKKTVKSNAASIDPNRAALLKSPMHDYATGAAFSIFLYRNYEEHSLSDILKHYAELTKASGYSSGVEREEIEGINCVKIFFASDKARETWWLDPERGYSIVLYRLTSGAQASPVIEDRVIKLTEAGRGIWFPVEAVYMIPPTGKDDPRRRYHYLASSVAANAADFVTSVFDPAIPAGYVATDLRTNERYQVAPATRQLEDDLNRAVNEALAATTQTIPARPATPTSRSTGGASHPMDTGKSGWFPWLLLAGGVVVLLCVILIRRRWTRAAPVLLACVLGTCGVTLASAEEISLPNDGSHSEKERHFNCAVNVAYVSMHLLHRTASVQKVGELLNAGQSFERLCSMADLKRAFESESLTVQAVRIGDVQALRTLGNAESVLILRCRVASGAGVGDHFGIALPSPDRMVLVDPPASARLILYEDLSSDRWLQATTGEVLVVTASKPSGPLLVLEERELDIGDIPLTVSRISARLHVRNEGTTDLNLLHIDGSCSCFAGSEGEKRIRPGKESEITVFFDKAKLHTGSGQGEVRIATDDPRHEVASVIIKFNVLEAAPGSEARAISEAIIYGRTSRETIAKSAETIDLIIPKEISKRARVQVTCSTRFLQVVPLDGGVPVVEPGERSLKYLVSWREAPGDGLFSERIDFQIDVEGEKTHTVIVVLRGDSIEETHARQ